jgi:hypothetical protein
MFTRRLPSNKILLEYVAVLRLAVLHALDSDLRVLHREDLDPRLDALRGGEVEHLQALLLRADVRAPERSAVAHQRERMKSRERRIGQADRDEAPVDVERPTHG